MNTVEVERGITRLLRLQQKAVELSHEPQWCAPETPLGLPVDWRPQDPWGQAYSTVFRDMGLEVKLADLDDSVVAMLSVSPIRATVICRSGTALDAIVRRGMHCIGHIFLNHGQGKEWLSFIDYSDETQAKGRDRELNNQADAYADALCRGISPYLI